MNIKAILGFIVLIGCLASMSVGAFLIIHSVRHAGETDEKEAALEIEHIMKLGGETHVVMIGLGCCLIALPMIWSFRSLRGMMKKQDEFEDDERDIEHEPSPDGKAIALLKAARKVVEAHGRI